MRRESAASQGARNLREVRKTGPRERIVGYIKSGLNPAQRTGCYRVLPRPTSPASRP
jgi:hypothetical protein